MLLDALYLVAFVALLPWMAWRRLCGGRPVAAPWTRLAGAVAPLPRRPGVARIWMHGVSVGEVQLLASLAEEIDRQAAAAGRAVECIASSSTTTGLEVAGRRFGPRHSFPCPFDFTWAVTRVLDGIRPDMLVLGELELWPNLLALARARGIPIVVANARMSERSCRGYRRIGALTRRMLGRISLVLARSREDADRFALHGARDVIVTGSMKFDGVRGDRSAPEIERLRRLAGLAVDDIVFLAGSTQAPEEQLAVDAWRAAAAAHPRLRLVIVPRHVERAGEIASLLTRAGLRWRLRSRLDEPDDARPVAEQGPVILLVDTTGELGWWWGTATIAFVGGSLDGRRGGQNMLEPAAYGAAVSFGPQTHNFRDEVRILLESEAAVVVADGVDLAAFLQRCLDEPGWAASLGRRAADLVASHRGARAVTAREILGRLPAVETAARGCQAPQAEQ
ncbi:MAG: 3-deoxy-D-manno-octulosonic acid transferase [Planctomycetia bacterium]|nr:3-deoxy-D-manno-octulosonic acid transferase [Planctomycetia bacterium]